MGFQEERIWHDKEIRIGRGAGDREQLADHITTAAGMA
jgi:hypothetical protein